MPCPNCGLEHAAGEFFVEVGHADGHPIMDETCVLLTRMSSPPKPLLPGTFAYHGTNNVDAVLASGLDPARCGMDCKHVCLAERPEVAANRGTVLRVDVSGLPLRFELGEARHHGEPIPPERIALYERPVTPDWEGWSDPAWRRNHSDCLLVRGLPQSRRLLRKASAIAHERWEGYTIEMYIDLVRELEAHEAGTRPA